MIAPFPPGTRVLCLLEEMTDKPDIRRGVFWGYKFRRVWKPATIVAYDRVTHEYLACEDGHVWPASYPHAGQPGPFIFCIGPGARRAESNRPRIKRMASDHPSFGSVNTADIVAAFQRQ